MKKIVYIMPAILLIAGSCTSQMYLGSGSDDLYYRPSQARKAAVAQTGTVQEKRVATADIFSGDTLIADNYIADTLYNNNDDNISDATNSNVIATPGENLYVYNNFSYPFYEPSYIFGGPLGFDFYYGFGGWYSPYYYSWYSPWDSPYYWGSSWYNPYYSWYYGYGYYPYDYYYGGGYYHHDHNWNNLPIARRSGASTLTGTSYASGNSGLRTNYARRSPSNSIASGRYSSNNIKRDNVNSVSRASYTGNTQNPGYERRTVQTNGQNNVRPDYQTQTRSYTPSYNTPRMSSKPAYNNSRTGSSSSSYSNNSRVSSGNSGSRVQYSSPGRASSASITHSSSPSYSGGSSGGSRGSSVSSSSSSSSSFKSSSSSGGNSGGGGGRRR